MSAIQLKKYYEFINVQLKKNSHRNIFATDLDQPEWLGEIALNFILDNCVEIISLDQKDQDLLLNYTLKKIINQFYRINQYYHFSADQVEELKKIYLFLMAGFKKVAKDPTKEKLRLLAMYHQNNLIEWIKSNDFNTWQYYQKQPAQINQFVICQQYQADLQMEVLNIDLNQLKSPVLDLGCGRDALLVHHLRNQGVEAFGADRMVPSNPYLSDLDWFSYPLKSGTWGSVISHLGFSNHFSHHWARKDLDSLEKYDFIFHRILQALKPGGTFYYAPSLPEVENKLSRDLYRLHYKDLNYHFKSTRITKI
ncbi:MAG: class I SAM-dependent methyltransferase [Candidatus Cyclobacteriaceae bacterium M3_2C_046]